MSWRSKQSLLLLSLSPLLAWAQDGQISGPQSSWADAGYSCDPRKCKLPDCACADVLPPGELRANVVPMFITFTADDDIQSYTLDAVNQFLAHRKNPNGCKPKMTYFTSLNNTNYTLVTDWYVAGHEIAAHTMTHVGDPSAQEIQGNLIALNALAGVPFSAITGFRAPYLNFTAKTMQFLREAGFTYDSSATASLPVRANLSDAFWPYSLDNGLANNCMTINGICKGEPKVPGLWEIPMYAFHDERGVDGIHLMDPWLDAANGDEKPNDNVTLEYMKATFTAHYNANRQPIGLYTHPLYLAKGYPGVETPQSTIDMINAFLDWAQWHNDVWIVSNQQLLEYVRHPVPLSKLDSFAPLKCSSPSVDPKLKICNGIPASEEGLLSYCPFPESPFYTCYGCPQEAPTPDDPNPPQQTKNGQQARYRVPGDCSTTFWDPIGNKCMCNSSTCAFTDESRPVGLNGANLTGGGVGGSFYTSGPSAETFISFSGGVLPSLPEGVVHTIVIALLGVVFGALGVLGKL